jgi:hypothetical protein
MVRLGSSVELVDRCIWFIGLLRKPMLSEKGLEVIIIQSLESSSRFGLAGNNRSFNLLQDKMSTQSAVGNMLTPVFEM